MFPSDHGLVDSLRSVAESDDALREILYGNAPCHTASQKELVNSLASERDRRMQELDAEIERLAAEKDRILQEYRVCTMALKSPIRVLPAEILCEIFELCIERTPWHSRAILSTIQQTISSLLITTWTCRRWRQIAHETPRLWRELPLGWRMLAHRFAGACVQEWLARAKNLPLTYTFAAQRHFLTRPLLTRELIESSVAFPTQRMRCLRLIGFAMDITLPLSTLSPDSFPLLEELYLKFHHGPLRTSTPTTDRDIAVTAFTGSSRLTVLHLETYIPKGVIESLPLLRVTSLWLQLGSHPGPALSFYVLRRCPNLTYLRLHAEYAPRDPHDDGSPIIADNLETLVISGSAYDIWEVLSTPNLKKLEWFAGSCDINHHVLAFLARAPCLTSLTLANVFIDDYADIRDILRLLPRVGSLTLQRCSLRLGQMYHALAVRSETETLVPCLRSLVLKEVDSYQDSPSLDAFVTMMRSRRAMSDTSLMRQLRIEVDVPDFVEPDDEIESKLGAMQEEGLELHFS